MKNVDYKKTTLQRLHLFLAMQRLLKETKYVLIIRTIKKKGKQHSAFLTFMKQNFKCTGRKDIEH